MGIFLAKTHLIKLIYEVNIFNFHSNGPNTIQTLLTCWIHFSHFQTPPKKIGPKIWSVGVPKWVQKRVKWVNLPNFQSIGRKTLISFPTPPFFAQLDSFLALWDTSENPLPPNLVPIWPILEIFEKTLRSSFRYRSKVFLPCGFFGIY